MLVAVSESFCPKCAGKRPVWVAGESGGDRILIFCVLCGETIERGIPVYPGCIFLHPECRYCARKGYHLEGCPSLKADPPKLNLPAREIRLPVATHQPPSYANLIKEDS